NVFWPHFCRLVQKSLSGNRITRNFHRATTSPACERSNRDHWHYLLRLCQSIAATLDSVILREITTKMSSGSVSPSVPLEGKRRGQFLGVASPTTKRRRWRRGTTTCCRDGGGTNKIGHVCPVIDSIPHTPYERPCRGVAE